MGVSSVIFQHIIDDTCLNLHFAVSCNFEVYEHCFSMSSTILPSIALSVRDLSDGQKHPFLIALGERALALRIKRGMTRKALSAAANVSERHLANLEYGLGNVSVLVLLQLSQALGASISDLLGGAGETSSEHQKIRELLSGISEPRLRLVRESMGELLESSKNSEADSAERSSCIALIGLRGAGKSTLGRLLAEDLDFPFIELSRDIERLAGCSISEIQALYGQNAYRRYERRAIDEALQTYPEAVIATPGGLVSDAATYNLVLSNCTTVWLQADPKDHMERVAAQGDMRPMAGNKEAMEDLKFILAGRNAFYAKAEFHLNTSAQSQELTFMALRRTIREALTMSI
jgi:XRE family transcriptional regulator, aerobic/anaerobic benzoate catabolism transcriptional regulator